MTFEALKLAAPLLEAVRSEGYSTPTPIQLQAIPHALEGRDVLGCAQTGTGKTAAFALPILQRLSGAGGLVSSGSRRAVRCLVLAPTRELASQIGESFATYGRKTGLQAAVIFGGVGADAQIRRLRQGVDIVVATPGRLLDLMSQRHVSLQSLQILVLDEADRMLDMGFIHDVKRILAAVPKQRQTLFFSATMPREIDALAKSILVNPIRVEVTPVATTAERVEQRIYFVNKGDKRGLLSHLLKDTAVTRALVFTRTKSGANRVAKHLTESGEPADAIHGNKSQNQRERALNAFRDGSSRVLVATDIAARGIDVDGLSHVINFDLPNIPESYVHRIGRTGRAQAAGTAISFCDGEERAFLKDIERTIRMQVPVISEHPFAKAFNPHAVSEPAEQHHSRRSGGGRGGQSQRRPGGGGGGSGRHHGRGSSSSGSGRPSRPGASSSPAAGASAVSRRTMPKWG